MTTVVTPDINEYMFELKYRPQSIDECILPPHDKETFKALTAKGQLPHLVLQSNSPGTGKTTVARALCNDINAEMLFVNGSDCKIDFVRNELTQFASTRSIDGRPKVIVIDEFDRAGVAEAQRHLRSFMEHYGKNCSIIITANNLDGIIKPLRSRCRVIQFGNPSKDDKVIMMKQMIQRMLVICDMENIQVDNKRVLAELVKRNFPDFRKCINQLDICGIKGVIDDSILEIVVNDRGSVDEVIQALKDQDIRQLKSFGSKYADDYSHFIEKLTNELYNRISDGENKLRMYELIGENNQFHAMASSIDVHLTYLFVRLAVELKGGID